MAVEADPRCAAKARRTSVWNFAVSAAAPDKTICAYFAARPWPSRRWARSMAATASALFPLTARSTANRWLIGHSDRPPVRSPPIRTLTVK